MSINSKMTALADEIRELSGTTTPKSIDAMISDVEAANTEISKQMGLIAQILAALENKVAGGSGEDVTEETNAYTSNLNNNTTQLEILLTKLNNMPDAIQANTIYVGTDIPTETIGVDGD